MLFWTVYITGAFTVSPLPGTVGEVGVEPTVGLRPSLVCSAMGMLSVGAGGVEPAIADLSDQHLEPLEDAPISF